MGACKRVLQVIALQIPGRLVEATGEFVVCGARHKQADKGGGAEVRCIKSEVYAGGCSLTQKPRGSVYYLSGRVILPSKVMIAHRSEGMRLACACGCGDAPQFSAVPACGQGPE